MYKVTRNAREKALNGGGPTLIESFTYRLGPHSSSDDDKRYRPNDELDSWQKRDPIIRFETYLKKAGILTDADATEVREEAEKEFSSAIKEAEKFSTPSLETLFTDVYKHMPQSLQEQMNDLIDEQRRLGESADSSQAYP